MTAEPIFRCSVCNSLIVRKRKGPVRKTCSSSCRQISYRQSKMERGFSMYRGYFYPLSDVVEQEVTL